MLVVLNKILLARTAATSVAQSLIMKVLNLALSLGSGMITARALGPAGRGEQSAIVLLPYLVTGLAGFGIAPALLYYTSRNRSSEGGLLFAASLLALATGLAGALVGSLLVPYYLGRYPQDVIHAAKLTMLFAPAMMVGYVFRANLEARGEFTASNASRVWPFLFTLLILASLWGIHRLTPFTAALAFFGPMAAQSIWLGHDLLPRFTFDLRTVTRDSRTLLSYGLRTYGTDVFSTLSTQVDFAFIVTFLPPASLGLYAVAMAAARQLTLVQLSLNMVLVPKASALEFDSALALVGRMSRISNLVMVIGSLVSLAVIPLLIPIVYGKPFDAAALIARILIIETFLMGAASVLAQAFNATGRPGIVSMFQAGWIVTTTVFLIALVPRLGLSGAATALALSSLVRLLATLACYPLVLHAPVPRLVPIAADIKYLLSKIESYRRHR